ncbi:Crp/Fnr family transcriptional regulator [Azonexus sp.]|uniref:Crp/Fnr family transcriptional regulator n=1 Tax=Azonexus sp. TaxID=1872668 RepID=UPI0035B4BCA5
MTKLPRPEIHALLADLPLFSNMSPDEIDRIARGSREIRAAKGSLLFHRGDPCLGFHLLLSGQIKLAFTSAQGNEKVVEVIRPGQSFGEALMFMESPYIVDAQALADSHLLHVAKTTVDEELAKDPKLARKMLASMAIRLHQMVNDLEGYALHSGKERIVAYLLRELAPCNAPGNTARLALPTTKGIVASRLNLTQEHFSRILHELSDEGLIVVHGREIEIPDIARLRANLA